MMSEDDNSPYGRPPHMGMPMQGMHPQMRYNQVSVLYSPNLCPDDWKLNASPLVCPT